MAKSIQKEYKTDFYAWIIHNTKLLKKEKLSEVDIENITEEIESMGKSYKRELINRLAVLIAHLLKWQTQPERRGNSWKFTIREQRSQVMKLIKESPSLKPALKKNLADTYLDSTFLAAAEMDVDASIFPNTCPFSLDEILNPDFLPDQK